MYYSIFGKRMCFSGISPLYMEIMKITTSFEDVVANRGEDLRFPISSSSGFSSPFAFYPFVEDVEGTCRIFCRVFLFCLCDTCLYF
jgi:hypothetical protein